MNARPPATLVDALQQHAVTQPDREALCFLPAGGDSVETLTYRQLEERVRAVAALLQERAAPGERAVLLMPSGVDYVVSFYACLFAGVIAVPAYPPESARSQHLARLSGIIDDAEPRLILADPRLRETLRPMIGDRIEILAVVSAEPGSERHWRRPKLLPDDIAFLQYTSGSTSAPKGVQVSHGNLVANETLIQHAMGLSDSDTMVSWLPLYHDMGLIGGLLQPIVSGFRCVLMPPQHFLERPLRWLDAISKYRATISGGPDFAYRLCAERIAESAIAGLDLRAWHVAFTGAEPIRSDTIEMFAVKFAAAGFARKSFYACYGLAEATLLSTGGRPRDGIELTACDAVALATDCFRPGDGPVLAACGWAQPDHSVCIIDQRSGLPVPDGQVGEIWTAGPSVAKGYWRNPEATAATFIEQDGRTWLRTGDLGCIHDGQLYVTGRLKDMLIVRGQNIYPQDLERAVEDRVAQVRKGRVAVFAVDRDGHEAIGVAAEIGRAVQKNQPPGFLEGMIRQAIADACMEAPAIVALLNPGGLPKTSSGKLQRSACGAALRDGSLDAYYVQDSPLPSPAGGRRPETETERLLAQIWAELLDGVEPSTDDSFLALGGNSITALQTLARLREWLGVEPDLRDLFDSVPLGEIAKRLDRLATGASAVPGHAAIPKGETGELSPAQDRMWFQWTLDPQGYAYNIHASLRLRGRLDEDALQSAFDGLTSRHEILRTRFGAERSQPIQIVMPAAPVVIRRHDLSPLSPPEREAQARHMAEAEACAPFDLHGGPLLRIGLLRLAAEDHILLVTVHHIVADGWSMNLIVDEIGELYAAAVERRLPRLPALPIQYADFASWQRRWLAEGEGARQLAYWRKRLGDEQPLSTLPTDHPRPPRKSYRGAAVEIAIDADLREGLKELARGRGVTLPMLLLAAFKVLLLRHGASSDLRVGATVANRTRVETEPLVGFFVNMLVLRSDLSGDPRFSEMLEQLRQVALEAQAHQDLPFEQLVEALQPDRGLAHNPLFQIAYDHQWRRLDGLRKLHGLRVDEVRQADVATQFDLILHTVDHDGDLSANFTYATDLYGRQTIELLAQRWLNLLRAVIADSEARIGALPLLSPEARRAALVEWNPAPPCEIQPDVPNLCLHQHVAAQAAWRGDAIALSFDSQQITYDTLNRRANRLAWRLRALGVGPDTLVGLMAERSAELVIGLLAILKAGGAYLPLDPSYPRDRLAYMREDSGIRLLLTETALHDLLPQTDTVCLIDLDKLDDIVGYPDSDPPSVTQPDNLAYCIYTSGSTGRPKGVLITHANVTRLFAAADRHFQFDHHDVWTLFHSCAFDFSVWEIFGALLYGGRLVMVPYYIARSPEEFHALLHRERITVLNQTPSAFRQLIPVALRSGPEALAALRYVIFGGEALEIPALRSWFDHFGDSGPLLVNMYGITETTVHVTFRALTRADSARSISPIGEKLADLAWYGLDTELEPIPQGVGGELYVGGAGLARGYLNRPALTAERFIPDPFSAVPGERLYRTGDLVRRCADGEVEYLGRGDQQVKIRGYRIELGEVEARLREADEVSDAVVLLRGKDAEEKRLVGYVVPDIARLKHRRDADMAEQGMLVDQWTSVFDGTYTLGEASHGPSFTGWNDSYGDGPIPVEEMQEWLDGTVECIRALHPRHLLEIGCGVGLLTQHLAPLCDTYHGTDISAQAIAGLGAWAHDRDGMRHIMLTQREARDFTGIAPGSFDAVVINSVAQYFPDAAYLVEVLEGAVRVLRLGGQIFVGDVRHRALLPLFHASVVLARAPGGLSVAQLRARIDRALCEESELVPDPRFFEQVASLLPGIAGVEMQLRRGRFNNELTRYRYDAVLRVGDRPLHAPAAAAHKLGDNLLAELDALLRKDRPPSLRIAAVPNRRLTHDLAAWKLLQESDDSRSVDSLRAELETSPPTGEDPEAIWELASARGYEAQLHWTDGDAEGRFDIVLRNRECAEGGSPASLADTASASPFGDQPWDMYVTDPLVARRRQQLGPLLRERLKTSLPSHMLPAQIHVLDRLPLTANGKLDRKALEAEDVVTVARGYVLPRSQTERRLSEIWQQLLGVERVGLHDNFFELGGHSLLATQVVSRVERDLRVKLSLRTLFETQDLEGLAAAIDSARDRRHATGAAAEALADEALAIVESLRHLSDEELARLAEAAS